MFIKFIDFLFVYVNKKFIDFYINYHKPMNQPLSWIIVGWDHTCVLLCNLKMGRLDDSFWHLHTQIKMGESYFLRNQNEIYIQLRTIFSSAQGVSRKKPNDLHHSLNKHKSNKNKIHLMPIQDKGLSHHMW